MNCGFISLPDADWLLGRYVDVVGGGGGQALGDQVAGLLKTCGNFRHFKKKSNYKITCLSSFSMAWSLASMLEGAAAAFLSWGWAENNGEKIIFTNSVN